MSIPRGMLWKRSWVWKLTMFVAMSLPLLEMAGVPRCCGMDPGSTSTRDRGSTSTSTHVPPPPPPPGSTSTSTRRRRLSGSSVVLCDACKDGVAAVEYEVVISGIGLAFPPASCCFSYNGVWYFAATTSNQCCTSISGGTCTNAACSLCFQKFSPTLYAIRVGCNHGSPAPHPNNFFAVSNTYDEPIDCMNLSETVNENWARHPLGTDLCDFNGVMTAQVFTLM
jgi:hypothetical protein